MVPSPRLLHFNWMCVPYAQRSQVETVNSMMKRNLGDHLRAKTPADRRKEQMLRVLTHNLMIVLARHDEG